MFFLSDKTSGSRMLKKARSFKEDMKGFIKRRPSTSSSGSGKPRIQINGGRVGAKDDVSY